MGIWLGIWFGLIMYAYIGFGFVMVCVLVWLIVLVMTWFWLDGCFVCVIVAMFILRRVVVLLQVAFLFQVGVCLDCFVDLFVCFGFGYFTVWL